MRLQIIDLKKEYRNVQALSGVSITLNQGLYGLLGPNGSGKSTLMNIITGNVRPTSGSVLWNGNNIRKLGKKYRKILGYVPQQQAMYPDFRVNDFLQYVAALREIPKAKTERAIRRVLRETELTDVQRYRINTLSGGMKQRLLIAQAVLGDPKLLVMDEPTVGLDVKQRRQICHLIRKISLGRIVLVSTHIVADLEIMADYVILIRKGNIVLMKNIEHSVNTGKESIEEMYLRYMGETYGQDDLL